MYAHKSCFSLTAVGVNVSVLLGDSRLVPVFSLLHHGDVRRFKGGLHPHQPLGVFSHGLDRFICSFPLRASYRPSPVLSVAQLREPSLRCLDPLHLGDIWVALIVPLRRLLVLLHPSLILAPELRGCSVVDPGYLHTRFAGRFFLTIPLRLAYSNRRRGFPLLSAGFGNGIGRAILYGGGASSLHFPHVIYDHSVVSVSGGNCHPVSLSIKVSKLRFSVNPSVSRKLSVNRLTVSCSFICSRFFIYSFRNLRQLVNMSLCVQLGFVFGVRHSSHGAVFVADIVPEARFPGGVPRDLQHVPGIRREDHVLAVADLPVDVALDLVGPAVRVVPEDHLPVSLHVLFPVRQNHDARPAGRFFLTIPGIRVYNSIRRSLRPSGDPVLNGNPSFCVAGGFVLYVYVVSVLINNFVQIELVCSLISVYYSGYINGCVSQSYRSSNHVAVVPSSFPIQIRLDDVAFFDYFLYRCNAQHL